MSGAVPALPRHCSAARAEACAQLIAGVSRAVTAATSVREPVPGVVAQAGAAGLEERQVRAGSGNRKPIRSSSGLAQEKIAFPRPVRPAGGLPHPRGACRPNPAHHTGRRRSGKPRWRAGGISSHPRRTACPGHAEPLT